MRRMGSILMSSMQCVISFSLLCEHRVFENVCSMRNGATVGTTDLSRPTDRSHPHICLTGSDCQDTGHNLSTQCWPKLFKGSRPSMMHSCPTYDLRSIEACLSVDSVITASGGFADQSRVPVDCAEIPRPSLSLRYTQPKAR